MDEGLQLHDVSVESESESSEYEVESDSPSLDHVSSDDDEELVEVRRKIQNMRSKLLEEKKKLDDDDDGDGDVVEATRAIEVEEVNELGEEYNIGREVNELSCSTRPVVITKCGICREPGHNRKTCTMPEPVPTDKRYKKKQTMPKGTMPEPVPTDKRYKNKQSMPDGIGVWTDSETGNTFMMSGQGPPVNIDDLPHVVDSNHTQLSQASTITNDPQPKRRWPDLLMESPERMHEATTRPVWK
ncbi:hypothetical protein IFM89_007230 [Coptis chinensis]|uniref:Uncharacterized protein n=1 Tax=Coptis chinensis TaxID=261450 RepID=A0A835IMY0_9MAGN|nr:hypothetical protein IFM89_007230 [Coptis chinensis]